MDLMDGTWLTSMQAAQVLDVTRQRMDQLKQAGILPHTPSPLGPLYRLADVEARRDEIEAKRGQKMTPDATHCRGACGPHEMTPENTMWLTRPIRKTCRTCWNEKQKRWRDSHPDEVRAVTTRANRKWYAKNRDRMLAYQRARYAALTSEQRAENNRKAVERYHAKKAAAHEAAP